MRQSGCRGRRGCRHKRAKSGEDRGAAAKVQEVSTGKVSFVVADITTEEGRAALLKACPAPDILLNNNAGPKPKMFLDTNRMDWVDTCNANYLAPILLVQAVLPSMIDRGFGRIVNITSAMVTTPRPHQTLLQARERHSPDP